MNKKSKIKSILAFAALMLCGGAWAAEPPAGPSSIDWSLVGAIASCVGVVVALITLCVAYCTLVAAKKIAGATYVANAFERYWKPDMLNAIKALFDFQEANPITGLPCPSVRNNEGRICAGCWSWDKTKCDNERRLVKGFFNDAWRAHKLEIITEEELKEICSVDAYKLYHSLIEPMEVIKNANYNAESFVELEKIVK